jgi:DNA transformation protein
MSNFVEHLRDMFRRFGPIEARKMFGGYGVYHQGLTFAIVIGDVLYLKADAQNASFFEDAGLEQFEYRRNGKTAKLSYYLAPETVMEDAGEAMMWARRSFDVALRANALKQKKKSVKKKRAAHGKHPA